MDVDNQPGAPHLRSRPDWQGSVALDWRARDRLTLSFAGRFNSRFFDSSVPTGLVVTPGHVEVAVTAAYPFTAEPDVRVTGGNLPSANYHDPVGFPAPARLRRHRRGVSIGRSS